MLLCTLNHGQRDVKTRKPSSLWRETEIRAPEKLLEVAATVLSLYLSGAKEAWPYPNLLLKHLFGEVFSFFHSISKSQVKRKKSEC